jgi:hypothetical protein
MSGKKTIAIAAVAAAIVSVPAGIVLGRGLGGDGRAGQARLTGVPDAALHPVGAPPAATAKAARRSKGSRDIALGFLETKRLVVPRGRSSQKVGPTPRHCRTINGYYFIPGQRKTKVVSEGDSPAGHRHWIFYRNNTTPAPIHDVVYGVVCLRGARLIG